MAKKNDTTNGGDDAIVSDCLLFETSADDEYLRDAMRAVADLGLHYDIFGEAFKGDERPAFDVARILDVIKDAAFWGAEHHARVSLIRRDMDEDRARQDDEELSEWEDEQDDDDDPQDPGSLH